MKPELIFINEKDGMVTLSKEQLERLIETAYNAGVADAPGIVVKTDPVWPQPTWEVTTVWCKEET